MKKVLCMILSAVLSAGIFSSCSSSDSENNFGGGLLEKETIRILSGSENKELSDILEECAKKTHVGIEMTYKGSVDIMNELKNGAAEAKKILAEEKPAMTKQEYLCYAEEMHKGE